MIYKITFGFTGKGQGWAETHSLLNASSDPATLVPTLINVAQKRANFLGSPFVLNAIRIAKFYDEVANTRARGVRLIKQDFTAQNPTLTGPAEPADVALLIRGFPLTAGNPLLARFAGNSNQTFCGSPPDEAVTSGGTVNLGAAGLLAAVNSFTSAMRAASMGWLAVDRADLVTIAGVVQATDGTATFTLQRDAAIDLTGQVTTVRVSGVNNGKSSLNGQLLVEWLSRDNFRTVGVRAFAGVPIGGRVRVYNPVPIHLSYDSFEIETETAQHDRGRPFGSKRGRRARIARG